VRSVTGEAAGYVNASGQCLGWNLVVGLILGIWVCDVDCAFKLYSESFFSKHNLATWELMSNAVILYKFTRTGSTCIPARVRHLPQRGVREPDAKTLSHPTGVPRILHVWTEVASRRETV
jgi:hypothetical protein